MIEFSIPDLPKTPNSLMRQHWAIVKKEKDKWHRLVGFACFPKYHDEPMKKARVLMMRRSTRMPDQDGLAGSFKFVLDGLVKAGVLIDDNPTVVDVTYRWEKSKLADQGIYVRVEEV